MIPNCIERTTIKSNLIKTTQDIQIQSNKKCERPYSFGYYTFFSSNLKSSRGYYSRHYKYMRLPSQGLQRKLLIIGGYLIALKVTDIL